MWANAIEMSLGGPDSGSVTATHDMLEVLIVSLPRANKPAAE